MTSAFIAEQKAAAAPEAFVIYGERRTFSVQQELVFINHPCTGL